VTTAWFPGDDVARVIDLVDRSPRGSVTYVDVVHVLGESHQRAGAALAELEGAGYVDWANNGVVRRRTRLTP
jgi:hypothetical protein